MKMYYTCIYIIVMVGIFCLEYLNFRFNQFKKDTLI
jgi:hypothetical protein